MLRYIEKCPLKIYFIYIHATRKFTTLLRHAVSFLFYFSQNTIGFKILSLSVQIPCFSKTMCWNLNTHPGIIKVSKSIFWLIQTNFSLHLITALYTVLQGKGQRYTYKKNGKCWRTVSCASRLHTQWHTEWGGLGCSNTPPWNSKGPPKSCRTQPDCENC